MSIEYQHVHPGSVLLRPTIACQEMTRANSRGKYEAVMSRSYAQLGLGNWLHSGEAVREIRLKPQ